LGIEGLEPVKEVIAAIWSVVYNLVNGVFAYALGELKKAGDAAMTG